MGLKHDGGEGNDTPPPPPHPNKNNNKENASYNFGKVLNFRSRPEKSLNSVKVLKNT